LRPWVMRALRPNELALEAPGEANAGEREARLVLRALDVRGRDPCVGRAKDRAAQVDDVLDVGRERHERAGEAVVQPIGARAQVLERAVLPALIAGPVRVGVG